jgi:hypothetical protein
VKGLRFAFASMAAVVALVTSLVGPLGTGNALADSGPSIVGNVVGTHGNLGGIIVGGCTADYSFCAQTTTDDAGSFALTGLAPGSYKVYLLDSDTYAGGWVLGPGTTDSWDEATVVTVADSPVNLGSVKLNAWLAITGRLSGTLGNLATVQVVALGGSSFPYSNWASVNADGSFTIPYMIPGTYTLRLNDPSQTYVSGFVTPTGWGSDQTTATTYVLTDSNVSVGTIKLIVGVAVIGSVTGPYSFAGMMAEARQYPTGIISGSYIDERGTYRVGGLLPGDYSIGFFNMVPGTYFDGYYAPPGVATSAPGTIVHVGPHGATLSPVQLQAGYQIQMDAVGNPTVSTWMNATYCQVGSGMCWYNSFDPSEGSWLESPYLPAGDYTIRFDDPSGYYPSGYYSSNGLVSDAADATAVHLPPSVSGLQVNLGTETLPGAPRNLIATPLDGAVQLSWDAPAFDGGSAISQYTVYDYANGVGCTTTQTTCTVSGLTNGQQYNFTVTATNALGTGPEVDSHDVIPGTSAAVVRLVVTTQASSQVAGASNPVTITAVDASGKTVTDYAGTAYIDFGDPALNPRAFEYTFTPADAGSHTFDLALETSGNRTISAEDWNASIAGLTQVAVTPAALSQLIVAGPATTVAGVAQTYGVMAVDAYGNLEANCSDTIRLKLSGQGTAAPTDVKLNHGMATFSASFRKSGTQTISAADKANASVVGGTPISVAAAPAVELRIGAPRKSTAGSPATITVTARDRFGNVATGYTGTVHFSSDDRKAGLPGDYTFTAADAGSHTFSVTLKTTGVQSVRVRDTAKHSIGGVAAIKVAKA